MINVSFYEKETSGKGVGVFASEFIPKGTLIWKLTQAKKYTKEEWEKLPEDIKKVCYPDAEGNFIYSEGKGESWNHSCNANTWWTADDELSARRDIPKDEEISYDYATTDIDKSKGNNEEFPWECRCGAKNCRKKLYWNDILRPEIYWLHKGHLPSWVQDFVSKNSYIRINTILIPEGGIQKKLIKIARKIVKGQKEIFYIDNKNFYTHITLYSPEYPKSNFEKVAKKVEEFSKNTNRIILDSEGFNTGWGYIGLGFKKSDQIDNLHKRILKELNPLREGRIRDKYESEIKESKYPPIEVDYIKKYDYHNVLGSFHPHPTLARFETEEIAQSIKGGLDPELLSSEITFPYLAISEMGPNGTCTKILKKFKLKK